MPDLGYVAIETCAGPLLVMAGPQGIREVRLGDTVEALLESVDERGASPDMSLRPLAASIGEYACGGEAPSLALDLLGSNFQKRVWAGISRIPRGETATYASLAHDIGMPSAVRAVASACGANRIAILIPCHRVIRSDGTIGRYRWGDERKRRLLDLEGPGVPNDTAKSVI